MYKERLERTIKLPTFSAGVVERVLQYLFEDFILNQCKRYSAQVTSSARSFSRVRRSLFTDDDENDDDMFGVAKSLDDIKLEESSSSSCSLTSSRGYYF